MKIFKKIKWLLLAVVSLVLPFIITDISVLAENFYIWIFSRVIVSISLFVLITILYRFILHIFKDIREKRYTHIVWRTLAVFIIVFFGIFSYNISSLSNQPSFCNAIPTPYFAYNKINSQCEFIVVS